jgi:uncharacterized RDD family membrane protein YckC
MTEMHPPDQPPASASWAAPPPAYAVPQPFIQPEPWGPLAHWGLRVLASILDSLLSLLGLVFTIAGIPLLVAGLPEREYDAFTDTYRSVGETDSGLVAGGIALMVLGFVVMLVIQLWNRVFRQGRTGQSIGKKVAGIRLVEGRTGQPVGAGMAFVRELLHVLDGAFYIGYLWPLWDPKRQTFADKILDTLVVRVPSA